MNQAANAISEGRLPKVERALEHYDRWLAVNYHKLEHGLPWDETFYEVAAQINKAKNLDPELDVGLGEEGVKKSYQRALKPIKEDAASRKLQRAGLSYDKTSDARRLVLDVLLRIADLRKSKQAET